MSQYEHKSGISWQNGRPLTSYTIKQNYYCMMDDNRHYSKDSHFWSFVPAD